MARFASIFSLFALGLLVTACGARTPLDDPGDPSAGVGGDGGAGAAPSGGGGEGAAGAAPPLSCDGLFVDGEPLRDSALQGDTEREIDAGIVAVDDGRVMVFHTLVNDLAEGRAVRAATLDAWGPWPQSLGPPHFITGAVREGMLAAQGFAQDAALLLPLLSLGTPGAVIPGIATAVAPATPYMEVPYEYLFELPGLPGYGASFTTSRDGTAFVGWGADADGTTFLGQLVTDASGTVIDGPWFESGCAQGRVRADVIAVEGGYLSAFSSGRGLVECFNDDGIPGPPTRLQVGWWRGGSGMAWQYEETLPEPITTVELVPRGDGAWLLHQTDGSTSLTYPSVVATALGPDGVPTGPSFSAVEDGRTFGPVAAAPFGRGFALAWVEAIDPSAPTVFVRVFDEDGTLRAEGAYDTSPAFLVPSRISLVSSPNEDALIVAWEAADEERRVVAARFACVQAL
jgi:hypothetical protein